MKVKLLTASVVFKCKKKKKKKTNKIHRNFKERNENIPVRERYAF